ncbi:hypothetical protein QRD40_24205 [Comamonas sp. Y6]|uniref:Uncharacterized protein n=1 Tax=Comamonas resistens TaxID=3046670 RepID=A0ABY8SZS0_9BURK|nr:hypothetical protein [Comamonas resistens]MDL5039436.1 hypothetical protein [Comamonas resistens]WHS67766.1 hypothetical protein QMY55_11880 [Comamonas resistens]
MARLFRLILVLLLPVLVVDVAMAAIPKVAGYRVESGSRVSPVYSSFEGACGDPLAQVIAKDSLYNPYGFYANARARYVPPASSSSCVVFGDNSSGSEVRLGAIPIVESGSTCPKNSTASGSSCSCNSGFEEKDGQCVAPDKCKDVAATCAGKKGGRRNYASASGGLDAYCIPPPDDFYWDQPKYPGCNTGCTLLPSGVDVALKDDQGKTWWQGEGKFSGGTCGLVMGDDSASPAPDNPADPSKPKEPPAKPVDERCAGQTGTVNGKEVCIPASSAMGVDWTGTTKNSDGTSTEGKTVTTCSDGICESTTTKTNKDANGQVTGTTTSTDKVSQSDYCSKNSNKNSMLCAAVNGNPVPGKGNQSSGSGTGSGTGSSDGCTISDCSSDSGGGPGKVGLPGTGAVEFGKLYEPKYPQGPVEVWKQSSAGC